MKKEGERERDRERQRQRDREKEQELLKTIKRNNRLSHF